MALAHVGGNIGWLLAPGLKTVQTRYYKKSPELFSACNLSAKYVSLPDMSDVCLTFTLQFYNGLHSIVRQMSDVSLQHFAYTDLCKCMFLLVFTYSSNPLTQIWEIVQLTRWAHRKFPPHFLPLSRHKKHGESLLLLLASKFRRSQHVNLKLWLSHVIGVKRWRGAECVHVSSPAKLHDIFEFQQWLVFTSCSQTAALTPESGDV